MYDILHISCILKHDKHNCLCFFLLFWRSPFVGSAWSFVFFSSPPQGPMTTDFEGFSYQIYPLRFLSHLNSWERARMSSAKQGNYWYHFITSLVWRGPWLGIEPRTSRTRSQYSTTMLSRRRSFVVVKKCYCRNRFNAFAMFEIEVCVRHRREESLEKTYSWFACVFFVICQIHGLNVSRTRHIYVVQKFETNVLTCFPKSSAA